MKSGHFFFSTFLCHAENISLYFFFILVVYNEQPAVYPESQKAFLKFTENTSKTWINVCLSKSNLLGKDFIFFPSLYLSPTASGPGLDAPPLNLLPSAPAAHRQPPCPSRSSPTPSSQHVSGVSSRGADCVSCWWKDKRRNEAQTPVGEEKAIPGSGMGVWEGKHCSTTQCCQPALALLCFTRAAASFPRKLNPWCRTHIASNRASGAPVSQIPLLPVNKPCACPSMLPHRDTGSPTRNTTATLTWGWIQLISLHW